MRDKLFWTLMLLLLPVKLVLNRLAPNVGLRLRDWVLSKQTSGLHIPKRPL